MFKSKMLNTRVELKKCDFATPVNPMNVKVRLIGQNDEVLRKYRFFQYEPSKYKLFEGGENNRFSDNVYEHGVTVFSLIDGLFNEFNNDIDKVQSVRVKCKNTDCYTKYKICIYFS